MAFDEADYRRAAARLSVPVANIMAMAAVESAGETFWLLGGKLAVPVRCEAHWFGKLTSYRFNDSHPDLSCVSWHPELAARTRADAWDQLTRARALDRDAADQATSWGALQIMGMHWKRLGYPSVTAFVDSMSANVLPTSIFAIHLTRLNRPAGWLVGEFRLEEMWAMVDRIRLGEHGFALVIAPDGALIAHGDPDKKALVAQARHMNAHPLLAPRQDNAPTWAVYDDDGRQQLAVAARIPTLNWTVVVEQPTREAYANATALQQQLIVAISFGLALMVLFGLLFGRRFIAPIFALRNATQAIAAGRLDSRVHIDSVDEFGQLGDSFNAMADKLIELQDDVKRKERQAVFGRMAAGLVHDLSHPIQNIGNSTRLLLRDDLDPDSRQLFHQTIERELATLKRFMDDLRNVVRPQPIERFELDVNGSVAEIVGAMQAEFERAGLVVVTRYADAPLVIQGDRFALERVYRNLITNAIQATAPGGRVTITTARREDSVDISVADTGSGIPPEKVAAIFDDFVTTKRRGLGLGLAISKRIVEQLDGRIVVESELGKGTSFTLRFPAVQSRPAASVG